MTTLMCVARVLLSLCLTIYLSCYLPLCVSVYLHPLFLDNLSPHVPSSKLLFVSYLFVFCGNCTLMHRDVAASRTSLNSQTVWFCSTIKSMYSWTNIQPMSSTKCTDDRLMGQMQRTNFPLHYCVNMTSKVPSSHYYTHYT